MGGRFEDIVHSVHHCLIDLYRFEQDVDIIDFLIDEAPQKTTGSALVSVVEGDDMSLGIYLTSEVKESISGRAGVGPENFQSLLVIVEEVSHFMNVYNRASVEIPITQTELELLAMIDQYVYSSKLIGDSFCPGRLFPEQRSELRRRIFLPIDPSLTPNISSIYEAADRYAFRYFNHMDQIRSEPKLREEIKKLPRFLPTGLISYVREFT